MSAVKKGLFLLFISIFTLLAFLPQGQAQESDSVRQAAMELALEGVSSNTEWIPYMEPDSKGVLMVLVPAGSFTMGSTDKEMELGFQMCQAADDSGTICQRRWFENEAPIHEQELAPFWIDQTEVSRDMYAECVAEGACTGTPSSTFWGHSGQPITRTTWFQAQGYCEWRGGRLPSEYEWEYAAQGPDGLIFPWGDEFIGAAANHCDSSCGRSNWAEDMIYVSEEYNDGYSELAPVDEYEYYPSWVGTLNQSGNVSEWTNSFYVEYPNIRTNIRSPKGGSFFDTPFMLRVSSPGFKNAYNEYEYHDLGLRCARDY